MSFLTLDQHACKNSPRAGDGCDPLSSWFGGNELSSPQDRRGPPNDLPKYEALPEGLPATIYWCQVPACKSKDNIWPRLDNFRSHLKHTHKLTDEEIDEAVALVSPEVRTKVLQLLLQMKSPLPPKNQHSNNSPRPYGQEPSTAFEQPQFPIQSRKGKDPAKVSHSSLTSDANASESSTIMFVDDHLRRILKIIKDIGYVLKKDRTTADSRQLRSHVLRGKREKAASVGRKAGNKVRCTKCTNFIGRPCELKKHLKRHTRPYGCTFPNCMKVFGSKSDWKRHETSQHFQLETWPCEEDVHGLPCGKKFHQARTLRVHLEKVHDLSKNEIDSKIAAPRNLALNSQESFWCGFCESSVDLREIGLDAWNERFNHIDNHFMGRHGYNKQNISEWLAPDDEHQGRGFSREPDLSRLRRSRSRSVIRRELPPSARPSPVTSFSVLDWTGRPLSEAGNNWGESNSKEGRICYDTCNIITGGLAGDRSNSQKANSGPGMNSVGKDLGEELTHELPSIFNKEWATKINSQFKDPPTDPASLVRVKRSIENSESLEQETTNSNGSKRHKIGPVRAAENGEGHDNIASSPSSRNLTYNAEHSHRELSDVLRMCLEAALSTEKRLSHLRHDLTAMPRTYQDRTFSARQSKTFPLEITPWTPGKDATTELLPSQASKIIDHPNNPNLCGTPEAPIAFFHQTTFDTTASVKENLHDSSGFDFQSTQNESSALIKTEHSQPLQTSPYQLEPTIHSKEPIDDLTTVETYLAASSADDRPTGEFPRPEIEDFGPQSPSSFLGSDVDWEALLREISQ